MITRDKYRLYWTRRLIREGLTDLEEAKRVPEGMHFVPLSSALERIRDAIFYALSDPDMVREALKESKRWGIKDPLLEILEILDTLPEEIEKYARTKSEAIALAEWLIKLAQELAGVRINDI